MAEYAEVAREKGANVLNAKPIAAKKLLLPTLKAKNMNIA